MSQSAGNTTLSCWPPLGHKVLSPYGGMVLQPDGGSLGLGEQVHRGILACSGLIVDCLECFTWACHPPHKRVVIGVEGVLQYTNVPFNQFCSCGIVGETESPISVHLVHPLLDLVAYEMGSLVTFNDFRGAINFARLSKASNGSPLSGTPA